MTIVTWLGAGGLTGGTASRYLGNAPASDRLLITTHCEGRT
jgi:hypothetical protein